MTTTAAPERTTTVDALQTALAQVGRQMRARLSDSDPATLGVVNVLATQGPQRASALAETLHLDASTVSRHVRALETSGHVVRGEDPEDRRAALLSITPLGRCQLDLCLHRRASLVATATAEWPAGDISTLARLLERFAEDLGQLPLNQETL